MIKLIASDLDGTLLLNKAQALLPETLQLISQLKQRGILFVSASGRQYANQYRLFGQDDSNIYICENGGLSVYGGNVIAKTPMDFDTAIAIARDIQERDGCEVTINAKDTTYLSPKYDRIERHMRDVVHYDITVVNSLDEIEGEILKVAVYQQTGIEDSASYFKEKWGTKVATAVSGLEWQDFMHPDCNKGRALAEIQKRFGISPEETMVFGDNFNDIQMLHQAAHSYAMAHAVPEVKAHAEFETERVEDILNQVLCL